MLGFKSTSFIFIGLFLLLIVISTQLDVSMWVFVALATGYIILLSIGSSRISSGFFMPVICSVNSTDKKIAITFDDGPAINYTTSVLEVLKNTNTPAAFFCIGKNIKVNPDLLRQIDREGHLIGSHSYSHGFFFDFYSSLRIRKELAATSDLVKSILQKEPRYFRPPYGVTTPNIASAVKHLDLLTIGWNVRTMDTVIKDKHKLLARSTGNLKSGDIVLFHDTVELTVHVLHDFISKVREQGFQIVRLDQLLKIKAYA